MGIPRASRPVLVPLIRQASAAHMSAFGGKADMIFCGNPLSRSLFGVKRTSLFATHLSAFDPKRTSHHKAPLTIANAKCLLVIWTRHVAVWFADQDDLRCKARDSRAARRRGKFMALAYLWHHGAQ
jgi:hypothetical protein